MSEKETLGLHNLPAPDGARSPRKRVGRGPGSGLGKTAGRGHKGQKARSGGSVRPGFEGGQMPLVRRVPKRGFFNPAKVVYQVVNIAKLENIEGDEVTPEVLHSANLVSSAKKPVKILGQGEATRAFAIKGCAVSAAAREKIEKAGGKVEA